MNISKIFYDNKPVEQINFEREFNKELEMLEDKINKLKEKRRTNEKFNYYLWTSKLNSANKALEVNTVTFS